MGVYIPDNKIQAALARGCSYDEFIRLCHAYHAEPENTCGTCQALRQISLAPQVPEVTQRPTPALLQPWRRVVLALYPTPT